MAAVLASSACAAGQRAQTADQKPTLDGTETSVGQLDLRGITIEAPPSGPSYAVGSSARMRLVVVNNGQNNDRLTSITASAITSWGSYATSAQAAAVQSPSSSVSSSAAPSSSSSSSSSPSGSSSSSTSSTSSPPNSGSSTRKRNSTSSAASSQTASSSAASTAAALPTPSRSILVPAGSRAAWGVPDTNYTLLLTGLTQRLFPGNAVRITFTFTRAGRVSVDVPVALSTDPKNSYIPESGSK